MRAPTVAELLQAPNILKALEDAWVASSSEDPQRRHEEGGWVFMDVTTGVLAAVRAQAGGLAYLDLTDPPLVPGAVVVATFHTHPNPSSEGWDAGPSFDDTESAWELGVPCLIRAENGIHTTGPDSRRGGLAGGPGFPP